MNRHYKTEKKKTMIHHHRLLLDLKYMKNARLCAQKRRESIQMRLLTGENRVKRERNPACIQQYNIDKDMMRLNVLPGGRGGEGVTKNRMKNMSSGRNFHECVKRIQNFMHVRLQALGCSPLPILAPA